MYDSHVDLTPNTSASQALWIRPSLNGTDFFNYFVLGELPGNYDSAELPPEFQVEIDDDEDVDHEEEEAATHPRQRHRSRLSARTTPIRYEYRMSVRGPPIRPIKTACSALCWVNRMSDSNAVCLEDV
jgi:hypothetical protein